MFTNPAGLPTTLVPAMAAPVDVPPAPDGVIATPAVTAPMVSITHNTVTRMATSLPARGAVKPSASEVVDNFAPGLRSVHRADFVAALKSG